MSARPPIAIRCRGLVKKFGRRRALAGIDLDVATPQIVGIIGPDGAGKTTLLRALVGLLEVEAAEATVLGYDLRGDVGALKEHVGYVPQAFSLHRDLSVMENLRFTARLHRLTDDELRARAMPILERTGLAPFVDRPAGALSGGMKQKLAIANALVPGPSLIVLDEPTAGVDVVARGEILAILDGRRHDTLVVLSTSYLDEMTACDRLVYLDDGRVVATGTPDELRAGVGVELYRAWGDDPHEIARVARALPWVAETHASGEVARIEVPTATTPGAATVRRTLATLPGVRLVDQVAVDMEATLLALARTTAAGAAA
ncbi:MAG: ABC transporter ATP-binding protein [Deltaproteobacteria bacterium]|nr:ABC transporter ATP-binding protein [Deltaproteobacteria bacterium]